MKASGADILSRVNPVDTEILVRSIESGKFAQGNGIVLTAGLFDTPLGQMIAITDEQGLYLLQFVDRNNLLYEIERLACKVNAKIVMGCVEPIAAIQRELNLYFDGVLTAFITPVVLMGTPFQKQVWGALQQVSYGETRSYSQIACTIGRAGYFRACAAANRANLLAIIIPCHRVIKANGNLCGYNGGVLRKQWLIEHEKCV